MAARYTNLEVIPLKYDGLKSLIQNSPSSRSYFLSLPVNVQLKLHEYSGEIHSAQDLHHFAGLRMPEVIEKPNTSKYSGCKQL